jgi:hypothetical protein
LFPTVFITAESRPRCPASQGILPKRSV